LKFYNNELTYIFSFLKSCNLEPQTYYIIIIIIIIIIIPKSYTLVLLSMTETISFMITYSFCTFLFFNMWTIL